MENKSGGIFGLLIVGLVLAVVAVTLSEGLRTRVLEALFGAEEEFDYEPSPPGPPASVNGSGSFAQEGEASIS